MSQLLISHYLNDLATLKRVSGTTGPNIGSRARIASNSNPGYTLPPLARFGQARLS